MAIMVQGTASALGVSGENGTGLQLRAPISAWYALGVLIATTLFAFIDRQIINLVAPSIQTQFGLSDLQLGALSGLGLALFASVASYPVGWLADRFGRRIVLGCCILVWSASTAAFAFQNSFEGLFAATVGVAIGEAALTPIIFAMIPDLFPERQRNAANFTFFAAALLGAALGFGLGGLALQWVAGHQATLPGALAGMDSWRVAVFVVALPGPVFALLLASIRMGRSTASTATTVEQDVPGNAREHFLPYARRHWRALVCMYGGIAAYSVPNTSTFVWLPVAMPRIFGVPSSSVGLSMGITLAVATVAGLILPAIAMKVWRGDPTLKPLRLAVIFVLLGLAPTILLLVAATPFQIYALAGMQLMMTLATAILMPGVLQQIAPPGLRSRLLAILGIVTALAQGLAPLAIGAVSGLINGPRGIIVAIVVVGLPGLVLAGLLFSRAPRSFLVAISDAAATEKSY